MDLNLVLWVGQILLALAFLGVGYSHTLGFEQASTRSGMGSLTASGRDRMRIIGSLEILGGIGLVLPAATGVLPWLTPLAAACLTVLMLLAIVLHARRPGEGRNIVFNVILGAIAAWSPTAGSSPRRSSAAAWIYAGGSHHTSLGFDVTPAQLGDLAAMCGIELVLVDERTRLDDLGERLRWSDLYWQLAKGF